MSGVSSGSLGCPDSTQPDSGPALPDESNFRTNAWGAKTRACGHHRFHADAMSCPGAAPAGVYRRGYEASALRSSSTDAPETTVNSLPCAADVPPSSRESEGREDCEARFVVESCCGG